MAVDEPAPLPPLVYGVWLPGQGWLRDRNKREFADLHIEYAEQAARLVSGKVRLIDDSMIALEALFLEQEALKHERRIWIRIRRWVHGLLGHGHPKQPVSAKPG